jgi:hypothetical protein
MRELHAWHGDFHRAQDVSSDADADAHADADAPATTYDLPKHEVLLDPEARVVKHLEYRNTVDAVRLTGARGIASG